MGATFKSLIIKKDPSDCSSIEVEFLVDSGAGYTLVPAGLLAQLGIRPHGEVELELADGTRLKRLLGGAYFEYLGEGAFSPVIFGEENEEPLLGVISLETLRLVHNPYKREIYPQRVVRM